MPPSTLAVFAGPSLPARDRIAIEGVTYLPPASRHDVGAASEEYEAILLIDGVFHHDLAVSTKEVYAASRRVPIAGAASIGALRAVECHPYGVRPLGAIARWYLREAIDGDDEVAVLVDPRDHRALSVPLVNVRYLCRLAARRGLLSAGDAAAVVAKARAIYYMERAWDDVLPLFPARSRADVSRLVPNADLKRYDAIFALRSMLRGMRAGGKPR